jgi:hypothetical protein
MMNRILKRPMFRMGGRSDDGIMSLRPGFQEGDQVKEPGYFQKSGLGILLKGIGDEARKAGAAVYDLGAAPINLGSRFFLGENPGFSGAKFFGLGEEEGIDPDISYFLGVPTKAKTSEMFGGAGTAQASETGSGETTGAGTGGDTGAAKTTGSDRTKELSDNDLKTMYEDLLPLFKSELSADDDELKRQKYLELAKFGANILAQPGGDLVGTIGRAAAPSIEGLTRVAETKRRADTAAKSLALEAALKQADPGTIMKQVRDIMRLDPDISQKDALAKVLSTGSATREATSQGRIDDYAADLLASGYTKDEKAAKGAAEAIEESGLGIGVFQKDPGENYTPGDYYIFDNGKVGKYIGKDKNGKDDFAEPGDDNF